MRQSRPTALWINQNAPKHSNSLQLSLTPVAAFWLNAKHHRKLIP